MATKDNESRQVEALEKMAEELHQVRLQLHNLNANIAAIIRQLPRGPLRP